MACVVIAPRARPRLRSLFRVVLRLPFITRVTAAGLAASLLVPGGRGAEGPQPREAVRSFAPTQPVNFREPPRSYITTNAAGWRLELERELVEKRPALATAVVARLENRLTNLLARLPSGSHERLRKLPVFVMLGETATAGGRNNGAEYFQRTAPDHFPLIDPRWRSCLVIYSAPNYTWLTDDWALRVLVHEFAHAWQLEQWPENQRDLVRAYRNARRQGLYRNVRDINGDLLPQAYALQNPLEYFAELSCAYFLSGEYEPFDRPALQKYDPVGFALIETLWGISGPPPPPGPNPPWRPRPSAHLPAPPPPPRILATENPW